MEHKDNFKFPENDVLEAFGISGAIVPLAGGEGVSYLGDNIVLKPVSNSEEARWSAELMNSIVEDGFRVARPVQTKSMDWIYDGWTAFHYIDGKEIKGRYSKKIEVAGQFQKAIALCPRPVFMDSKNNPYVIADRMTWREQLFICSNKLESLLLPLVEKLKPLNLESQLIHGDLTGNILFHKDLEPAVIDMTPYWHPADFASAVIVEDSIVWDGAPTTLIDQLGKTADNYQLILRAVIWRIKITDELIKQGNQTNWNFVKAYQPIIDMLLERLK